MENWLNKGGAVADKYEEAFDKLVAELQPAFKKLEGRMQYRDMYHIAILAVSSAVGNIVRDDANRRDHRRPTKKVRSRKVARRKG